MNNTDIPSPIDFHNQQQVEEWIKTTVEKRPYRPEFFAAFATSINSFSKKQINILEIGSGPGHLARFIMENCNVQQYTLLDFSAPMHEIAKKSLARFVDKTIFLQKNFKLPQWTDGLPRYDIIVTMQAAHEVRHKEHVPSLFKQIRELLPNHGLFLYSDHYYTDASKTKHPELYLTQEEQQKVLKNCGFKNITLVLDKAEMALYRVDK